MFKEETKIKCESIIFLMKKLAVKPYFLIKTKL